MDDIIIKNNEKVIALSKRIHDCNEDYRLFGIDVDGIIYNIDSKRQIEENGVIKTLPSVLQEFLVSVDFRATKRYRELVAGEESADSQEAITESYAILDAILMERPYIEILENGEKRKNVYPKPDYDDWYTDKNLFPNVVEQLNYMLLNRRKNDFFIFVTHRNPEREALVKMKELYRLFPNIDAILTPSYYIEGTKVMTDKGVYTMERLSLSNLHHFIMIDDLKKTCQAIRKVGGKDIRMLPEGFDERYTLADHMSKITSLDPYNLQFTSSFIDYTRLNPDYVQEVDVPMKVKKL